MDKRFLIKASHLVGGYFVIVDTKGEYTFPVAGDIASNYMFFKALNELDEENKNLKAQLYSDDEDGICNQCKHHYLVKDEDSELGYYKSRCKKGHYECARVSLVHCEDFEIKNGD